ncbi:Molybdate-binding periplasmic protein precursor [Planctomycetes bacterium Pan216]|uniref:Molybdate-binding periplasmic protein n=1 Tax=Kolteria novifilia TaxID=2527975 RepID=A0A518B4X9_9BACT|nr:Molybdate-binding periplasmic protein precursor [Planctomycetes bacterium Pan216]
MSRVAHLLIVGLTLCSCASCSPPGPSAPTATITLFAAASMTDACEEIVRAFEEAHGVDCRLSVSSSSTLARQIEHGAPADLFLSANIEWREVLERSGLVASSVDLVSNRLVLIVPTGNNWSVTTPEDLASDKVTRFAIADPEGVPAGIYAKRALERLGLWQDVRDKVLATENVRHALALVARREVPAGIVYATDAAISGDVDVISPFAPDAEIIYPLMLTKRGEKNAPARKFFDFMQSSQAHGILMKHGFLPLEVSP